MNGKQVLSLLLIVAICSMSMGCIEEGSLNPLHKENVTGKVTDKERVVDGTNSYYLVYLELDNITHETEVITIRDSIIHKQFHSSDLYGQIEEGKVYEFTVFGYRSGFLSAYRNVLEFEEM